MRVTSYLSRNRLSDHAAAIPAAPAPTTQTRLRSSASSGRRHMNHFAFGWPEVVLVSALCREWRTTREIGASAAKRPGSLHTAALPATCCNAKLRITESLRSEVTAPPAVTSYNFFLQSQPRSGHTRRTFFLQSLLSLLFPAYSVPSSARRPQHHIYRQKTRLCCRIHALLAHSPLSSAVRRHSHIIINLPRRLVPGGLVWRPTSQCGCVPGATRGTRRSRGAACARNR